jgi:RNA polymerase sigma-70 factor, ECF subfamily
MTTTTQTVRNGVDTATLFTTLDAIKAQPEIAAFTFRAQTRWLDGAHNRTPAVAEEEALRRLWEEHAGPLLAFTLRLTAGDRGRAEDVVQETLLQAWRHPDALDPARGPARPWLLTVARRIVIDQHRARSARPTEVGEDGLAERADDDGIDAALDRWLVADALSTLTRKHREALVHTYYAGRTVNEAAAILDLPVGTVKSRVFYGLRALRSALMQRGVTT